MGLTGYKSAAFALGSSASFRCAQWILTGLLLFTTTACSVSNFSRGQLIPASDEPTRIEFSTIEQLIIIEAEINGVTGTFLFDNGFSLSAVNQSFANRAGVSFTSSANIKDANNQRAQTRETTVSKVVIGSHQFIDTGFYLIDTKRFLPCHEIDGIIGASIINKANWKIESANKQLQIASKPFPHVYSPIRLSYSSNNSAFIDLTVKGNVITTKLDFGSNSELRTRRSSVGNSLSGELVEQSRGIQSLSATGPGQHEDVYSLTAKIPISSEEVIFPAPAKLRLHESLKYEGYLGAGYYSDMTVVLNSTQEEMSFKPDTESGTSRSNNSYGMSLYPIAGTWKLIQLNANDPLLADVELMQTVHAIDDIEMTGMDVCQYRDYLTTKQQANESLRIKFEPTGPGITLPLRQPAVIPLQ